MIQSRPVNAGAPYPSRRHALRRHGVPLAVAAALAFAGGLVAGGSHRPAELGAANAYARAWERGDLDAMYRMLTEQAREEISLGAFRDAHRRAAATATTRRLRLGAAGAADGGVVTLPAVAETRIFGPVRTTVELPFAEDGGEQRVAWERHLAFPGLQGGEKLTRRIRLPERGTLTAADGTVLARGPGRSSDDPELSASIAGQVGPVPEDRRAALRAEGVPDDAQVGLTGLERALDDELRGSPGGRLLAGTRTLVVTAPEPAGEVRSSIAPSVQRAAVAALAGRLGGVVALDPRTGEVRAAAGIGLSGLQPPGSVFKIVTLAKALEEGETRTSDRFPVETATTLEGVRLENSNAEACGGSLVQSFAKSCNTVFAPLGAKLGAKRLVEAAEAFGFNRPPAIEGAATSVIPPAEEIGDDLAVGSTAIGQGRLQASALQIALAAATIAERGVRVEPTLLAGEEGRRVRVVEERVARIVARAMRAVVRDGTGAAAALDDVGVAGKTGTAELASTVPPPDAVPAPEGEAAAPDVPETTAWFTAYAPATKPRIAVAVMLPEAGTGGAVAAPAAKGVLEAGVRRRG